MVGLRIRIAPHYPVSKRISEVTNRLLEPARVLQKALSHKPLKLEFYQRETAKPFDLLHFVEQLSLLIGFTETHVLRLKKQRHKGRHWDSDLKADLVYAVSMLCEYISNDFEPTRNVQGNFEVSKGFRAAVELLGVPLFSPNESGRQVHFDGAIRDLVNRWNRNKRDMLKQAQSSRQ